MLNSLPDTRRSFEEPSGFLTPNEIVGGDHFDELDNDDISELKHEAITLSERRKASLLSSHTSSSSSVEIPQRDPTVDAGKYIVE